MAISPFAFNPADGWNNGTRFPTYEADETQVRADLQELHDQTRDYINALVTQLENFGVETSVQLPENNAGLKYIRLTSDRVLETSADGTTWSPIATDASWLITGDTPTTLNGLLSGNGSKVSVKPMDSAPTAGSVNPVTSGGVKTALDGKQNTLTFDNAPTAGSSNPVKSGGVKTALDAKQNTLTFDTSPTAGSVNPVTSGGVKQYVDNGDSQVEAYCDAAFGPLDNQINGNGGLVERIEAIEEGSILEVDIAVYKNQSGATQTLSVSGLTSSHVLLRYAIDPDNDFSSPVLGSDLVVNTGNGQLTYRGTFLQDGVDIYLYFGKVID